MKITASLRGKSIHVIVGQAPARSAYEKALRPFINAGATFDHHESPKAYLAYLNATRPVVKPDLLIVGPWFKDDMKSEEFVDLILSLGFVGMYFIGSGIAYQIQDGAADLQCLARSVLTDLPAVLSTGPLLDGLARAGPPESPRTPAENTCLA